MTEETWRKSWGRLISRGGRVRRGATGRSRSPFLRRCRELEAKARPLESASTAGEGGVLRSETLLSHEGPFPSGPGLGRGHCSYFLPLGGQAKGRDCRG